MPVISRWPIRVGLLSGSWVVRRKAVQEEAVADASGEGCIPWRVVACIGLAVSPVTLSF